MRGSASELSCPYAQGLPNGWGQNNVTQDAIDIAAAVQLAQRVDTVVLVLGTNLSMVSSTQAIISTSCDFFSHPDSLSHLLFTCSGSVGSFVFGNGYHTSLRLVLSPTFSCRSSFVLLPIFSFYHATPLLTVDHNNHPALCSTLYALHSTLYTLHALHSTLYMSPHSALCAP